MAFVKPFFLFISFLGFVNHNPLHDFHFSNTEIVVKSNTLQISTKVFKDDLEIALNHHFQLKGKPLSAFSKEQICQYYFAHFSITSNEKKVQLNCLGFEEEKESLWLYAEAPFQNNSNLSIENSLFFELYPDQKNLNHFTNGKTKKSGFTEPSKTSLTF